MKLFPLVLLAAAMVGVAQKPVPTEMVYAKSLTAAPGAVVCADLNTVNTVFDLYVSHWEDEINARMTRGRSVLIYGQPLPAPNPKTFGCALAKPGTKMTLYQGYGVPVVSFRQANGKIFRGVTLLNMLSTVDPTVKRAAK